VARHRIIWQQLVPQRNHSLRIAGIAEKENLIAQQKAQLVNPPMAVQQGCQQHN
jgi:hypothetical protein